MEDYLSGLYRSLGLPLGAEFSFEDVTLIYRQVFHLPSSTTDARAAVQECAGADSSWSCVGENLLDVLLEMEREREKKEKCCWELRLQRAGNVDTGRAAIGSDRIHHDVDSETQELRTMRPSVKRLQKSAGQLWARLASEGASSAMCQGEGSGVRGQAWGSLSLSDALLLLDVKYDAVSQLLYKEMLQEHYSPSTWEGMPPWQQQKEVEDLEDLAEDALEPGDMASLAELPGAFRIYSLCAGASWRGGPESREQCWTAVSLLWDLHTFRQREKDAAAKLNESLDSGSLRLMCLYIRLATARAQRETTSYGALLAARQGWETWPRVKSPCGPEQAALWLREDPGEQRTDLAPVSPRQALLQLLVTSQEQEREQLLGLVRGLSPEDLQDPDCCQERAALRHGCVKELKTTEPRPQSRLEGRCLDLLARLSELQEVEAREVLSALRDGCAPRVRTLRDEYESRLQTRSYSGRLHSLLSEAPGRTAAQSCCGGQAEAPNSSSGSSEDPSGRGPGTEAPGDEPEEETTRTVIVEVLPYLEVSDETSESVSPEGDSSAATCPRDPKNQGSLITLAWGKPFEDRGDRGAEVAGTTQDGLETRFQQGQFEDREDGEPPPVESESTGCYERGTLPQREDGSGCDLQEHVDTQQAAPSPLSLPHPPEVERRAGDLAPGLASEATGLKRELAEAERPEMQPSAPDTEPRTLGGPDHSSDLRADGECGPAEGESAVTEREGRSAVERERTVRDLMDVHRKVEQRHRRDRERQMLRVQERLSIVQSRKAEEGLPCQRSAHRLMPLTQDLLQEGKDQQKTALRERLEQLRRERSCVVQSKRDRNTAGFRELLGPEALRGPGTDDGTKGAAAHLRDSLKLF